MGETPESPGEMEIPLEDQQTDRGREQIGNQFKEQLDKIKADLYKTSSKTLPGPKGWDTVAADESRLFANFKRNWGGGKEYNRRYFAYSSEGKFEETAHCETETERERRTTFTKTGRIVGD